MNTNDIHPSILAVLNGETYTPQPTELTDDAGEKSIVMRFTFGNKEPTLLEAIKAIIELSENSELSNEFFFEAEEALNYVSQRLDISSTQALLLALLVNNFTDQHIDVTDLGRHLRCTPIALLPLLKEMDGLEERGYMVCNRSGNRPTYRIPFQVLESLNNNEVPQQKQLCDLSCEELISELDKTFEQRSDNELTFEGMKNRCRSLVESNPQLHFVELVKSYALNDEDFILLLYMVSQCVNYHDNHITLPQLRSLYDHRQRWANLRQQLQKDKDKLQELSLIDYAHDGGFGDRGAFCLTATAKRDLFTELDIDMSEDEERPQSDVMSHNDISARHHAIDSILHGSEADDLSTLISHCDQERLEKQRPKVGF